MQTLQYTPTQNVVTATVDTVLINKREEFVDTKRVVRIPKSRQTDNAVTKRKRKKEQALPYKILHKNYRSSNLNRRGTQVLRKGSSTYAISCTRRVTFITDPVISHEYKKNRIVIMTNGTYRDHL